MSISEFERKRIRRLLEGFCEDQVHPAERSRRRLTYRLQDDTVLLLEARVEGGVWVQSQVIELCRDPDHHTWSVHVANASGSRQAHPLLGGWEHLEDLLAQVSGEPTAIVWGQPASDKP
ncbi:MAG: hypothetical protein QNJ82_04270 [Gammaproteobacteria bacterium]|nr:hypothetical protein [Gammaproteobacteria bacterium]